MRWITLVVLAACGPSLEATGARHVILEVEAHELVDVCDKPCHRVLRSGERLLRCGMQESGWHLNPTFAGHPSPPPEKTFDMATIMGQEAAGFAVCKVGGK